MRTNLVLSDILRLWNVVLLITTLVEYLIFMCNEIMKKNWVLIIVRRLLLVIQVSFAHFSYHRFIDSSDDDEINETVNDDAFLNLMNANDDVREILRLCLFHHETLGMWVHRWRTIISWRFSTFLRSSFLFAPFLRLFYWSKLIVRDREW